MMQHWGHRRHPASGSCRNTEKKEGGGGGGNGERTGRMSRRGRKEKEEKRNERKEETQRKEKWRKGAKSQEEEWGGFTMFTVSCPKQAQRRRVVAPRYAAAWVQTLTPAAVYP